MDARTVMQSEISQREKDKYLTIFYSYVESQKQKQTYRYSGQTGGYGGERFIGEGVVVW